MRHVVGPVADVREGQARGPALGLEHGEQVGQDLAGVVVVGERVDDGHTGMGGHLLERALREGAPHDRCRLRAEDARDVGDRLALPHARQTTVDDHREAAEPGDRADERHLGAQGRLVEQDRHGAWALEAAVGERRRLQGQGAVEHGALLGGREVVVGEEVAQRHRSSLAVAVAAGGAVAASSSPGRASTNRSSSSVVTTSGGASRMASGATGLTMNPASRARAATAAEWSPARVMACSRPAPRMPVTSGCPRSPMRCCEVLAGLAGVVEQAFRGDGVEHGEPGGAGERVAAEGRAVHARGEHRADLGPEGDERADRHAATEALGQGHRVGHDARLRGRRTTCRCGRCRSAPRRARAGRRPRGSARGPRAGRPSCRAAPPPRPGSARGRAPRSAR